MESSLPETMLTEFVQGFWKFSFLVVAGLVSKLVSSELTSEWMLSHHLCKTLLMDSWVTRVCRKFVSRPGNVLKLCPGHGYIVKQCTIMMLYTIFVWHRYD